MKKAIFAAILMVFSASFGLAVFDSKVASAACASDGAQLFSIPAWYRGLTKEGSCEIKTISNKQIYEYYSVSWYDLSPVYICKSNW